MSGMTLHCYSFSLYFVLCLHPPSFLCWQPCVTWLGFVHACACSLLTLLLWYIPMYGGRCEWMSVCLRHSFGIVYHLSFACVQVCVIMEGLDVACV